MFFDRIFIFLVSQSSSFAHDNTAPVICIISKSIFLKFYLVVNLLLIRFSEARQTKTGHVLTNICEGVDDVLMIPLSNHGQVLSLLLRKRWVEMSLRRFSTAFRADVAVVTMK